MNYCDKVCGGELVSCTVEEQFLHEGNILNVDVDYSICIICGEEYIVKEQIIVNEERVRLAKGE